ncbi:hypothetical protein [Bacillus sp. A260]|uniref:hypothetical protein n=1 Tax=Bacillus sp. A260 TaxID=2660750 RepID=UPI001319719D|nr:hypothetical protein [Bacillus sp. A260]QGY38509.1 hypothetical protein GD442_27125 [Bacillus sp. A260]
MELKRAIEHILDGNGLLFLGAGFSKGALNILGKPLGDATELSHFLCDEMEIGHSSELGEVSGYYLQSASNELELNKRKLTLIKHIQNLFFTRNVEDYHKIIANCPWRRIYTTNYDDVIEFAHDSKIDSYFMNSNFKEIIKDKSIVHLNGYARTVTSEQLDNEFKLTNRSYLEEDFLKSSSKKAFDHDVKNSKVIVIIGASLKYDLDIQRVLFSSSDIKKKTIFIDREKTQGSPIEEARKNLIGEVHRIGTKKFTEEINEIKETYKPISKIDEWKSFEKLSNKFNNSYKELEERDIWDLLISGDINHLLVNSNKDNNNYMIQRSIFDSIKQDLGKRNFKIGIIHSNLGNGKTCTVNLLAYQLCDSYNVYLFKEYEEGWELEVEKIGQLEGEKIIIIENYQNYLDLIDRILDITDESCKIILTSRTFINNSTYYRIEEKINDKNTIEEYDINTLKYKEIKDLSVYLKERKFDKIFDLPLKEIEKIIVEDCGRRMSDVLLYIIKSKAIKDKLDHIIDPVLKNHIKKEILLAIIISNACSLDLEFNDIVSILDIYADISLVTRDSMLSEFVDVDNNNIKMRSAVLSSYILVSKELNKDIISVMEKLVLNADRVLDGNKSDNIRKLLISISNIREILVQTQKDDKNDINNYILRYFEKLIELEEFKNNIFFWLQYAMACIDAKQFDRAEVYFKNAYKSAYSGFNTFQIDTQYGRFLLEVGLNEDMSKESFDNFMKANNYLKGAILKKPNQSYYVYKQAYLIEKYINKYVNFWDRKEKAKALEICKYLQREIQRSGKRHFNVLKIMDRTIRKILLSTTKHSIYASK